MDQCNCCNNVVVDGIPYIVRKRELDKKCVEVFGIIYVTIHESGVKACHCHNKSSKIIFLKDTDNESQRNDLKKGRQKLKVEIWDEWPKYGLTEVGLLKQWNCSFNQI